jgi:hypothetical protein
MARLPNPGGDDGQWGTILNDYLTQSLKSDGTLKDDIVVAGNVADGALPQAKITNLTTDLSSKVDTTDARLTPNQVGYYPPQGYGFFAATEVPSNCRNPSTAGTGTVVLARAWVPAGNAISSVSALVTVAGTLGGGGTNGFAVYTDAGVLVAQTTSNNNLWTSTGWRTGTFSSPIAAQSTGRFIYVGLLVVGYSGDPTIIWNNSHDAVVSAGIGSSNRRSFYNGGQSSFPASFNPASYGTLNSFIPLVGLS